MSYYRRSFVQGGSFFFTITLADRSSRLLIEQIERLRLAYRRVRERHPFQTLAICVLPDHLHAIWTLPTDDADYAIRWQKIKSDFSRAFPAAENRSASKEKRREKGIWQRRYWEHQIRDEEDLIRHVDYIHYNPLKHGYVSRVADWPYSSFHRFVRDGVLDSDWGSAPADSGSWGE